MIRREMRKNHLTGTDISRKLNVHVSTITGMLNRPTIKVQKLVDLCKVFQYNFFREIAEQLPYEQPRIEDKSIENELFEKIEQLKEENKTLKIKVEVLEDVITKLK